MIEQLSTVFYSFQESKRWTLWYLKNKVRYVFCLQQQYSALLLAMVNKRFSLLPVSAFILLSIFSQSFAHPFKCRDRRTVTAFYQCQCHFLRITGRAPVAPGLKFPSQLLKNFIRSCLEEFSSKKALLNGCLVLTETKTFKKKSAIDAQRRYYRQCLRKWRYQFQRERGVSARGWVCSPQVNLNGKLALMHMISRQVADFLCPYPLFWLEQLPRTRGVYEMHWVAVASFFEEGVYPDSIRLERFVSSKKYRWKPLSTLWVREIQTIQSSLKDASSAPCS